MAASAAAVGVTLSVGEIIACFTFGRFLSLMWILINALQLLVFLGAIWQVRYTRFLTIVFRELKRVSWGEYFDDLEMGKRASELLFGGE